MKHLLSLFRDTISFLRLRQQFPLNPSKIILICPHGIGDTYYVCALLKAYLSLNKQVRIILVVKKEQLGVAKLFPHKRVRVVTTAVPATPFMVVHRTLFGTPRLQPGGIYFSNPFFLNSGAYVQQFGQPKHTIGTMYKAMLNLPSQTVLEEPNTNNSHRLVIKKLIKTLSPKGQKILVFAPEANSISQIDNSFWDKLVEKTSSLGYKIIVLGRRYHHPKAQNLVFDLSLPAKASQLLVFIQSVDHLVSLRSGLCDLVLSTNTPKTIIYPNKKSGPNESFHKCYTLRYESSRHSLTELVYSHSKQNQLITSIIQSLTDE